MRRIPVIGLAGGIGAGKSRVAAAFARLGCVVSDSDAQARATLDRPEVRDQVVAWWGPGVLGKDGRIDRGALARIVFADPAQRQRLEGLVHPLLRADRQRLIANPGQAAAVVIDAPLLFEAGVDKECDVVVFVDAPRAVRLARVQAGIAEGGRAWTEEEFDRREAAQMPLEEKRRRSGFEVNNAGDPADLDRQVGQVLRSILSRPFSATS